MMKTGLTRLAGLSGLRAALATLYSTQAFTSRNAWNVDWRNPVILKIL
jgi:hypothetical protein